MKDWNAVKAYAERWGVCISGTKPDKAPFEWSSGPGPVHLSGWSTQPTLHHREGIANKHWPFLLHDLGHAVYGGNPNDVKDELRELTGFEVLSVRYLGLAMFEWETFQEAYGIDREIDGRLRFEWQDTPAWWQRRTIERSCKRAAAKWFVDGVPTWQRVLA